MLSRQSSYVTLDTLDCDGVLNVLRKRMQDSSRDDRAEVLGAWKALYIIRHMRLNNQAEFFEVFDGGEFSSEEAD
jgi:hypothetical protein